MPKTKAAAPATSRVPEPLWTADDVSAYLGGKISVKTLMNWRSAGDGPPYLKIGTTILYRPASVEKWAAGYELLNAGQAA